MVNCFISLLNAIFADSYDISRMGIKSKMTHADVMITDFRLNYREFKIFIE